MADTTFTRGPARRPAPVNADGSLKFDAPTAAAAPSAAPVGPDEARARFWTRYGPLLFGSAREPQTAQEWLDAAVRLRGLSRLDDLANRLEAAVSQQQPATRQRHGQAGDIYYDEQGQPCCPQHEKPLKEGKYGLYCTAKDPNGKNGYCDYRLKQ